MNIRCFQVHLLDNVATLLDDVSAPSVAIYVLGSTNTADVIALEPITAGHKIAVRDIAAGEPVIKFGVEIGRSTAAIRAGEWVHLHNCRSNFDERSQTLNVHTGATTDMKYE
jgi:hypothetical protein